VIELLENQNRWISNYRG